MVLTYEAVPELATTLKRAFRAELVQRATAEITQLGRVCSQRKLEIEIDLAQGYLCRLRTGQGVPSVALVSLLALLRAEPARLEELRRYWALPVEPPSSRVHGPDRQSDRCWRLKTAREKEFVRGVACALGMVADPAVGGAPDVAAMVGNLVSLTVEDFRRAGADEADLEHFRSKLETRTARSREIAARLSEVNVQERPDVR